MASPIKDNSKHIHVGALVKLDSELRFVGGEFSSDTQVDKDQIGIVLEINGQSGAMASLIGDSATVQWANGSVTQYSLNLLEPVLS